MPDVRYVCLSDMHLGAENSLLTNLTNDCSDTDPRVASPVLVQLVECLQNLILLNESIEKPTLILNGDILELALTTDNEAAMAFERFIELISPARGDRLFKEIVYIPGNHDHHLWETARETQYVNYISHNDKQKSPGSLLDIPWHTTKLFKPDPVPAVFLNGIIQRYPHLTQEVVNTVYPNYGLISDDSSSCVIFSHGHFIESMYMLMSELRSLMFPAGKPAESIYAIEAENFAWIDFFWSTMGRSGNVGSDVELVYDKLQDEKALGKLLDNLVDGLDERYDLPGWDWADKKILRALFHFLLKAVRDRERCTPEEDLSPEAEAGLKKYLEGAIFDQITQERSGNIPPHATFVFGHTHKPFQRDYDYEGFHPGMRVYNTGGWVVDTLKCASTHGGAVLLVDENYDTTSLWMYREQENSEEYKVSVEAATHSGAPANPFYQRILGLVNADQNPWRLFSEIVASAVPMRYKNLQIHIDRG
jgi:UDP-2,3-diacylglucosamine pyrophosphatase LpxH